MEHGLYNSRNVGVLTEKDWNDNICFISLKINVFTTLYNKCIVILNVILDHAKAIYL